MTTMLIDAARAAIARIGWRISPSGEEPVKLEVHDFAGQLMLRVSLPMIDIVTGDPGHVFMEDPIVPYDPTEHPERFEREVMSQGLAMIRRVWMHEHNDHVTIDGVLVKDPHAEGPWIHPLRRQGERS